MSHSLDIWDFDKWMKVEEDVLIEDDPECLYVDNFVDFMDRKGKAHHFSYEFINKTNEIKVLFIFLSSLHTEFHK